MDIKEMKALIKQTHDIANTMEEHIRKEYALEHSCAKIGDIVEDHIGKLLVEYLKVSLCGRGDVPCCVYYGKELRKDGEQKKRQSNRGVWQPNIISVYAGDER